MKSMIISGKHNSEAAVNSSMPGDKEKYPYGLKIHLDEDSFAKLELGGIPKVGDKFMMLAMVEVSDTHKSNSMGDEVKVGMGLQITDLELKTHGEKKEDTATKLYG